MSVSTGTLSPANPILSRRVSWSLHADQLVKRANRRKWESWNWPFRTRSISKTGRCWIAKNILYNIIITARPWKSKAGVVFLDHLLIGNGLGFSWGCVFRGVCFSRGSVLIHPESCRSLFYPHITVLKSREFLACHSSQVPRMFASITATFLRSQGTISSTSRQPVGPNLLFESSDVDDIELIFSSRYTDDTRK